MIRYLIFKIIMTENHIKKQNLLHRFCLFVTRFCLSLNFRYRRNIIFWNMCFMVAFGAMRFLWIRSSHTSFCHNLNTSVCFLESMSLFRKCHSQNAGIHIMAIAPSEQSRIYYQYSIKTVFYSLPVLNIRCLYCPVER